MSICNIQRSKLLYVCRQHPHTNTVLTHKQVTHSHGGGGEEGIYKHSYLSGREFFNLKHLVFSN